MATPLCPAQTLLKLPGLPPQFASAGLPKRGRNGWGQSPKLSTSSASCTNAREVDEGKRALKAVATWCCEHRHDVENSKQPSTRNFGATTSTTDGRTADELPQPAAVLSRRPGGSGKSGSIEGRGERPSPGRFTSSSFYAIRYSVLGSHIRGPEWRVSPEEPTAVVPAPWGL
jgi:hypothetical protein